MRILFDQGTPVPLRRHLSSHDVATAFELGWATFQNGDLLRAAEERGFEVLVTTDQNLGYQQNLTKRRIAVVVITTTSWPRIQGFLDTIVKAIESASPGSYTEAADDR